MLNIYIQDNEMKRNRAEKRASEEARQKRGKQQEIVRLIQELQNLKKEKEELLKNLRLREFQKIRINDSIFFSSFVWDLYIYIYSFLSNMQMESFLSPFFITCVCILH